MKVTLGKVMEMERPLAKLSQVTVMPARTTFQVCMLARKLTEHGVPLRQAHNALIVKYGVKDEKTGATTVTAENAEKFKEEMNALLSKEVEIHAEPVSIPGSMTGLSAADLMALDPFVTVGEEIIFPTPGQFKVNGKKLKGKDR